jgi:hypothetical protein
LAGIAAVDWADTLGKQVTEKVANTGRNPRVSGCIPVYWDTTLPPVITVAMPVTARTQLRGGLRAEADMYFAHHSGCLA